MSTQSETVPGNRTEDRPNQQPSERDNAGTSTVTHRGTFPEVLGALLAEFAADHAPVVLGVECTGAEITEHGVTLPITAVTAREKLDWSPLAALPRDLRVVDGTLYRGADVKLTTVEDFVFDTYLGHVVRPRWVTDYLGLPPDDGADGPGNGGSKPDPEPVPPTQTVTADHAGGGVPDAQAEAYAERGWLDVFPLPAARKSPPPAGLTGRRAPWTDAERAALVFPAGCNYGLRTPAGLLAIDVDHYDGKTGAVTLAELEAKLGALPATWRVTSHGVANPSGQRWFRVPAVAEYESAAGKDIEVIHRNHRYSVLPPSTHPKGGRYAWISPDDWTAEEIPLVTRLPELPAKWVDYLTSTRPPVPGATPEGIVRATGQVAGLIRRHRHDDTEVSNPITRDLIRRIPDRFERGTSRYDTMVGLFWEAAILDSRSLNMGHADNIGEALDAIAEQYRERVGTDRRPGVVEGEIHRAMVGAFAKQRAAGDVA